ncbi:MAG TPA: hypothetical protein VK524_06590 [Polyangiaceae bacterium]|nr:hypothetical protein [Polyangiaceae bacterium]
MDSKLRPDVIARVRLLSSAEGGRQRAIPPTMFGVPFFFEGEGFDCRLLLDQLGVSLEPGQERAGIPIKFLFPEYIKGRLRPGDKFKLWEGKDIAEGEVTEVLL